MCLSHTLSAISIGVFAIAELQGADRRMYNHTNHLDPTGNEYLSCPVPTRHTHCNPTCKQSADYSRCILDSQALGCCQKRKSHAMERDFYGETDMHLLPVSNAPTYTTHTVTQQVGHCTYALQVFVNGMCSLQQAHLQQHGCRVLTEWRTTHVIE